MSRMEAEGDRDGNLTEADYRVAVISELVEHVRLRMIPYLTSRPDLAPRHYAAACLARCNRLLSSMIALRSAGYPDVIGLPLRSLLECWYLGIYSLVAPDEAFRVINAGHAHQLGRFDETWPAPSTEWEEISPNPKPIIWKTLSTRVEQLAHDHLHARVSVDRLYEVLYRIESLTSVHGGLGVITGHVEGAGTATLSILELRREPSASELRIRMGASLLEILAQAVAIEFGLSTIEIERLSAIRSGWDAEEAE
jgi:hypothetical protein